MYRSMEYLLPPVTVQDIVPPRRKKNEHTPDNLRGKCPMIVPVFLTAGRTLRVRPAGPKITLRFPRLLVYMCVRTYHVRNNYVTYTVAMRPY